ncbi:MAG: restriction endonuclease subunit S, partial [bacterium]
MTEWPRVELGRIADVAAGDSAPQGGASFAPDGIPFVRMQDVGRHGRTDNLTETTDKVTDIVAARLRLFRRGSILIPKSGASIRLNHRAILGIDAHVVSHLAVVTPHASINGRFLYYWLTCVDMASVAPASDYPSLRLPDLARVPVPLPPLAKQERIVQILDEAEALRRLRAEADERASQLAAALFEDKFGGVLGKALSRVVLADLAEVVSG